MATAELRRRTGTGEEQLVARIVAHGRGRAKVEPEPGEDPAVLADMLRPGVTSEDGRRLTLADGAAFVVRLPEMFHGSRFWADVTDEEDA